MLLQFHPLAHHQFIGTLYDTLPSISVVLVNKRLFSKQLLGLGFFNASVVFNDHKISYNGLTAFL